jgi:hypothetical protein
MGNLMRILFTFWSGNQGIIRFSTLLLGFVLLITKDQVATLLGGGLLIVGLFEPLYSDYLQRLLGQSVKPSDARISVTPISDAAALIPNHWLVLDAELRANLSRVDLAFADLSRADLSDLDLTGRNLFKAKLIGANLSGANLSKANLFGADLGSAYLIGTNLFEADLTEAQLQGAYLYTANLTRANLTRSNLIGANLHKADLTETSFVYAEMAGTTFGSVNLKSAIGLSTVQHKGPSIITFDTLQDSINAIPDEFLTGVGIEGDYRFLHYERLGLEHSFNPCFISYTSRDAEFAIRLYNTLQKYGVVCWLDDISIEASNDIAAAIKRGLRYTSKRLICCSEASLKGEWVRREVEYALEQEKRLQNDDAIALPVLIPLALDPYLFSLKVDNFIMSIIKWHEVHDFVGWEHDGKKFNDAVEGVVASLRVKPQRPALPGLPATKDNEDNVEITDILPSAPLLQFPGHR